LRRAACDWNVVQRVRSSAVACGDRVSVAMKKSPLVARSRSPLVAR
jgi:hypothetical protein